MQTTVFQVVVFHTLARQGSLRGYAPFLDGDRKRSPITPFGSLLPHFVFVKVPAPPGVLRHALLMVAGEFEGVRLVN